MDDASHPLYPIFMARRSQFSNRLLFTRCKNFLKHPKVVKSSERLMCLHSSLLNKEDDAWNRYIYWFPPQGVKWTHCFLLFNLDFHGLQSEILFRAAARPDDKCCKVKNWNLLLSEDNKNKRNIYYMLMTADEQDEIKWRQMSSVHRKLQHICWKTCNFVNILLELISSSY